MNTRRDIFLSVAEASADMHAAALVREARELGRDWQFHGMTGPRLRELGVETIHDFTAHSAMLAGVLKVALRAWQAQKAVLASWTRRRPDLVIFCDSPALHMPLAARARAMGLKVLYYIAPQTWASREGRNRRIARDIDRLACILPFEEDYFRSVGVRATYVGHPLFETLSREVPDPAVVTRLRANPEAPVLALLPGSRRHVIEAVLPLQLEVVRRLADRLRGSAAAGQRTRAKTVRAVVSCAAPERLEQIRSLVRRSGAPAEIVVADNASVLTAADLVLVASGTATLHVAHYRKPMIVLYDAGRMLETPYAMAGGLVVKSPHLSLVNVLAGARVVPEFMPFVPDIGPVLEVTHQLLDDAAWRSLMIDQINRVVAPLEIPGASRNVCALADELLQAS